MGTKALKKIDNLFLKNEGDNYKKNSFGNKKIANKERYPEVKLKIFINFNIAARNYKSFYKNFANIMKENIVRPNFNFIDTYEEKICLNIIESFGDLKKYIKAQYPNQKVNQKNINDTYSSYIELFKTIQNDINNKIKTVPTDIKKYSILKGIK